MKHSFVFVFFVIILFSSNSLIFCQDFIYETEIQEAETQEASANEHNTHKYSFRIARLFGVIYGQSIELVYPTFTMGEYLSELLWDVKPVFYLGLNVDYGQQNIMDRLGVFVSASVKIGIPGDSGVMEDRDWASILNKNLTNFSSHTNRTNGFYWADILVGMSIPLKYLYITPFLSGSWMHFSFSGRNGYKKYARKYGENAYYPINDNPETDSFSGEVIEYEQNWFLLAPGVTIGTNILSSFSFKLSFLISPLIYCEAIDKHLITGKTYYDFTSFGLYLEPKINVSYRIKMFDFSLEFAYRYINSRGESYEKPKNSEYVYLSSNDSGTGISIFDIRFLMGISF